MRYLLMIHTDEAAYGSRPNEAVEAGNAAYAAYTDALKTAGAWLGGERLRPTDTATTVQLRDGRTEVLDGPYADTKEQFGGYYMIEAPDLDSAIAWAVRCPGASHGTVELRPIWEYASEPNNAS